MQSMVAYWSGCRQKINGSLKPSNGGELSERTAYKDVWKEGKVKVNSRKWWSTVELTIVEKCHLSRPAAARKGEVTGTQGEKAAAGVCLKGVAVFGGGTESHHGQGDMQLLSLFSLSHGRSTSVSHRLDPIGSQKPTQPIDTLHTH